MVLETSGADSGGVGGGGGGGGVGGGGGGGIVVESFKRKRTEFFEDRKVMGRGEKKP